ncbi:MAG TPA: hypothetical protein PKE55_15160, partial [Kiritimatiellia bacterium]|nr:hypothetical protein [Kiritimatiellia bacterium]
GREVWAVAEPSGYSMERRVELVKDAWGVDFRIRAELPEGRAAVEVMVEPEAGRRLARTLWVDGSFDEDVTFLSRGDD